MSKSVHEIVKKEKEIHAGFAFAPHTVNMTATVWYKNWLKREKALNLCVKDMKRKWVPTDGNLLNQKAWSLQQGIR